MNTRRLYGTLVAALMATTLAGCKSPEAYRIEADQTASGIIAAGQNEALGRSEPFTIERPSDTLRRRLLLEQDLPVSALASLGVDKLEPVEHWPDEQYVQKAATTSSSTIGVPEDKALRLTLLDALQVAARNNRDYQSRKEDIFRSALTLDLESNEFRSTYGSLLKATLSHDGSPGHPDGGVSGEADLDWSRRFRNGAALTGRLGIDLVRLLTKNQASSLGILADASISVPLLRGAGEHIVAEPLTQAQRDVIYSIHTFERYKRSLAVQVASDYLGVLRQLDQVENAAENYNRLMVSVRRAERLAEEDRLPEVQVDLARQDALAANDRLIRARDSYQGQLDSLKITLGLPTDAKVELVEDELARLPRPPQSGEDDEDAPAGSLELPAPLAVEIALARRLDLRTAHGETFDAQRQVVVAADGLKADLTLVGSAQMGSSRSVSSAGRDNAELRPELGYYSLGLTSDLPWERTAERNAYRNSLISLERATRSVQQLEDQVKLQVRNALRRLRQARQSYQIQGLAVQLAAKRVAGTKLTLEIGRGEIRDVLEAEEDLVSAKNALTAALVSYRVTELQLQRDMGVLEVDEKGLWREYQPDTTD
jgi:outer membrane protein TolC